MVAPSRSGPRPFGPTGETPVPVGRSQTLGVGPRAPGPGIWAVGGCISDRNMSPPDLVCNPVPGVRRDPWGGMVWAETQGDTGRRPPPSGSLKGQARRADEVVRYPFRGQRHGSGPGQSLPWRFGRAKVVLVNQHCAASPGSCPAYGICGRTVQPIQSQGRPPLLAWFLRPRQVAGANGLHPSRSPEMCSACPIR
jgi:hypothetical protein